MNAIEHDTIQIPSIKMDTEKDVKVKIHIGCGSKYLPGFKHLDIMKYDHIDYLANANDLKMIKTKSVDEMYACHVLEHFGRNDTEHVLNEWNRVLKPGGILRLAVPDFNAIIEEYTNTNDMEKILGLLYGGQNYKYNFHFQAFDLTRMTRLLEKTGFAGVEKYDWKDFLPQNGGGAIYDDYSKAYIPHMDFENGRLMSLNIIAAKVL